MIGVVALIISTACAPQRPDPLGGHEPAISGVPDTPPMGWNSWHTMGCEVTEAGIKRQADALVSTGLRDAGYRYVVVDDCWSSEHRGPDGSLQADPDRFPSGMADLGRYLHRRGLGFGVYAAAGSQTCAQFTGQRPGATGSGGHEKQDAQTFASWEVDYLKYDWCSGESDHDRQVGVFTTMRDALRATSRPIVYAINPNSGVAGSVPGAEFDWGGIATTARISNDIAQSWQTDGNSDAKQGILPIADAASRLATRVRPGSFNDPDSLTVGVDRTLTPARQRTQLSLWAMIAAPMMLSNDLTTMTPETRALLTNSSVIDIDQDRRASAGAPVGDDLEIWARAIGEKGLVVALTNRAGHPRSMSVELGSLGLVGDDTVSAVDAWTGKRYDARNGAITVDEVATDDTVLLQIV